MSDACRSCGAPVCWAAHERTGRLAPLEVVDGGGFVLTAQPDADQPGVYRAARPSDVMEPHYGNHFATCPQRDEWRR